MQSRDAVQCSSVFRASWVLIVSWVFCFHIYRCRGPDKRMGSSLPTVFQTLKDNVFVETWKSVYSTLYNRKRWVATQTVILWCAKSRQTRQRLERNGSVLRHRPVPVNWEEEVEPHPHAPVLLYTPSQTPDSLTQTATDIFDSHWIGLLLPTEACKVHKKRSIQTQACCESKWHIFSPSSTAPEMHLHELLVSHNRVSPFSPHTKCKHGSLAQPWPSAGNRYNTMRVLKNSWETTPWTGEGKKREENGTIYKERFMRL